MRQTVLYIAMSLDGYIADRNGGVEWLTGQDGGADIVQQLMREDLIDRFHISVIPVILGDGIRLFGTMEKDVKLRLVKTESYNGISELIYEKQ